jgi:hypothetical protein
MNKETQEYWITDTGEWGSNTPDTVQFIGHHANIHEAFDMVQDWELPAWAAWLSRHPHELTSKGTGAVTYCTTCEDLADQFGVM